MADGMAGRLLIRNAAVLIPLKSGHRFNRKALPLLLEKGVLIPLKSGHRFNLPGMQMEGLDRS